MLTFKWERESKDGTPAAAFESPRDRSDSQSALMREAGSMTGRNPRKTAPLGAVLIGLQMMEGGPVDGGGGAAMPRPGCRSRTML